MICNARRYTSRLSMKAKSHKGSVLSVTRVLLPSVQPGGEVYQPPLQRAPFPEEILHRYLKRHPRKLLGLVAMLLYSALQQMRLQSSIRPLAAFLRTVLEHLHERFLLATFFVVQQAHCGSLRHATSW